MGNSFLNARGRTASVDLLSSFGFRCQFMNLPGWSSAASYFFHTSHTEEHPMSGGSRWSIR
eukprot:1110799-Pelagomonas_calceolata.AAC.1